MRQSEWDGLQEGDVVQGPDGRGYIVQGNYMKSGVILSRIFLAGNRHEWKLLGKAMYGSEGSEEVPEGFTPHEVPEELRGAL